MKIQLFNNLNDIPGIEKFIHRFPVFATQEYANYLKEIQNCDVFWFCGFVWENITFILPFAVRTKYFFKRGEFLTSSIYLNEPIDFETEREFLNSITLFIKEKKVCDWIQQPPNWAIFNSYPKNSVFAAFGTYKINLQTKNLDELFNIIDTKDRSDIRKAIKEEVEIKQGFQFLSDALMLISATAKIAGISSPSQQELTYLRDQINVFISYFRGVPQTASIFYTNKYAWFNMYAGSKDKPFRGSNSLLYWTAIKEAKENGVLFFDFVGARINPVPGSKQEKIQRFKEHFGGELIKGYLWKMPVSKFRYNLYNSLIKTVSVVTGKKFKADIIDQERNR
ncbi:MAG TPA: hypothetical protein DHV28_00945 [Ignavibacteriales bacterium]|nr:hypothetical protein [Ignavibacteriales bacterium]